MRTILMTAIVLMGSSPALAQPTSFEPSSAWQLDYAETHCRIARAFGEDERQTVVFFEQHQPATVLTWVVAGAALEDMRLSRELTIQFGPGLPAFEAESPEISFGDFDDAIRLRGFVEDAADAGKGDLPASDALAPARPVVARLDLEEGRSIEWLRISQGDDRISTIRLGDMEPVYEAMNACMDNLLTHWGVDPAKESQRTSGPVWTNMPAVVRRIQDHYPAMALWSDAQADLHMRVMIDEQGKVTGCHLTNLTEADAFNDHACNMITRHAEFEPALDAAGEPMASYYATVIAYRTN